MAGMKDAEALLKEQDAGSTESAIHDLENRDKTIIRTSIIGILANVFLAGFKAVIGLMTHSVAITLDAVNNISDAGSSLITIVGTKLAGKEPDKKHPFGYGRMEYLSAMVISLIVLYAGITSFTESVKKIIKPETPSYTSIAIVIVTVAVLVKIVLGAYVKKVGERVHSDSLVNSGQDATLDSVISAATVVAAVVYITTGLSLEAWLGAVISLIIIKSGVEMLRDTLSQILGERADIQLARDIKAEVKNFPGVHGAYDLVLNNYGPDRYNGSIHIEVPDTTSACDLDDMIRQITIQVYMKYHVILTAIGVYSMNTHDNDAAKVEKAIREKILKIPHVLQMHGFYRNEERKTLRFDCVVSFDSPSRRATYKEVCDTVQAMYPDYHLQIAMDMDYSEL